jgi:hypothetical protein
MRPLLATFPAILICFLMLSSVLVLEHPTQNPMELDETDSNLIQFTSARASSYSFIASGGSSTQNIDAEHIEANPNGGWIIGSEYNTTLTFGTHTLQPTSPYGGSGGPFGEFFLAVADNTGTWQSVFGADHSFGAGGLSFLTDVALDGNGEILVTGYFYGEIGFTGSGGNPVAVISNTNTGYHWEGFLAKADSMGNWLWANSFTTQVNGSGEYSSTSVAQMDSAGDVYVSGEFQGETDFGGTALNVSSTQVYVTKFDGQSGMLDWVVSGSGVGTSQVFDIALSNSINPTIKLATIADGRAQWATSTYFAVGTLDTVIVELDANNGGVLSLNGIGALSQQTVVTAIEIGSSGHTYLAGTFGGTISGSGWSATAIYGGNDVFVAKEAQSSGWSFVSGSSAGDRPWGLAVTSTGLVIFSGIFSSAFTVGSTTMSPSNDDGYVVGLSSAGALDWTEKIGGSQYDYVWSMSVNMSDFIGIAGSYSGSMTHDGSTLTSSGVRDAYVWVFDPSSLKDSDGDSIVDVDDNCPNVANSGQVDTDGDSDGDECDSDDDNDGLTDNFPDLCPRNSEFNWTSMQDTDNPSASTDWDNDGCKDDVEDLDDDNDLILDVNDLCPYTSYSPPRPTWISSTTNDIDGDGCRDSDEDLNDDDDSFDDSNDDCPTLAGTSTDGTTGCLDTDGDGWSDTTDDCPFEAGNSTLNNKNACPDDDGDGWSNADDAFPNEMTQWSDIDFDGFGDNTEGVTPDDCPSVSGTSTLDRLGCFDADEDGFSNADPDWPLEYGADYFPNDATQWSDFDDDGFGDNWANATWTDRKSSWPGEMLTDATTQDACPTRSGTSWRDDTLGCPDADGDGWYDAMDAFMGDATQWEDADGDGYGDNTSGNEADACPSIPGNSTIDRFGCMDSDGDGYSNPDISWGFDMGGDAFPNEPTQWADADGDGYGENPIGLTPDDCPSVRDTSNIDRYGCADTDGDGISDPDDVWTLADGADACISSTGNSSADRIGCFDGDGDGYSNPTPDWTVGDGADAYPDDPLLWLNDKSADDGVSSTTTMILGIGGIIALVVVAGLAVLFLRKPDKEGAEKSWNDGLSAPMGGAVPTMAPNMYAQPVAVQPDPAREYCNGLMAQGYPHADAIQYTQHYYPGFQG